MLITNKKNSLIQEFIEYLRSLNLSDNSIRFYKSDLTHFSAWIIFKMKSAGVIAEELSEVLPFLQPTFAHQYKDYLITNQVSPKTINRRLSSLRKFSEFLQLSKIISFNFAEDIVNIPTTSNKPLLPFSLSNLVGDFQKHLEGQKASHNTVKNYIADIRHFSVWLENQTNLSN